MPNSLRHLFPLDPGRIHLNHGSFGGIPTPVQEALERWQQRLIASPNQFMFRERAGAMDRSLAALADYLGSAAENLVFVDNATTGMNIVVRSLDLQPGDEILTTNHEYGAVNRLLNSHSRPAVSVRYEAADEGTSTPSTKYLPVTPATSSAVAK